MADFALGLDMAARIFSYLSPIINDKTKKLQASNDIKRILETHFSDYPQLCHYVIETPASIDALFDFSDHEDLLPHFKDANAKIDVKLPEPELKSKLRQFAHGIINIRLKYDIKPVAASVAELRLDEYLEQANGYDESLGSLSAEASSEVKVKVELASQLFREGKLTSSIDVALIVLRESKGSSSERARFYATLIAAYDYIGKSKEALALIARAERDPDVDENQEHFARNCAVAYFHSGNLAEAHGRAETILNMNESGVAANQDTRAMNTYLLTTFRLTETKKLETIERLVKLNPWITKKTPTVDALANCYINSEHYDKAQALLEPHLQSESVESFPYAYNHVQYSGALQGKVQGLIDEEDPDLSRLSDEARDLLEKLESSASKAIDFLAWTEHRNTFLVASYIHRCYARLYLEKEGYAEDYQSVAYLMAPTHRQDSYLEKLAPHYLKLIDAVREDVEEEIALQAQHLTEIASRIEGGPDKPMLALIKKIKETRQTSLKQ